MKTVSLCGGRSLCAVLLALAAAWTGAAAGGRASLPRGEAWFDYRAIIWHPQKAGSCAALKELGIDAGVVIPEDRERPAQNIERIAPLLDCGLAFYVENIATDFYSAYHRYSPGKPVNWRFVEIKKAHQDNPQDLRAFMRDPSLSDPQWQKKIRDRLTQTVRAYRVHRPLFYNLGDEPGIADLSAFWDFDFSSHSLAGMRRWLKRRYGSLAALNRQWGSRFANWSSVVPMTTAEAMKRSDGNYSAWADFKEWMDVEFARAIERGTLAIHAADPGAYSAIEGGQIPGWGGYDYSRLANAVDLMELYDGGGNVEIARSVNPNLVLLKTSSDSGALEIRDIWRSLLRGGRGVIFWDPEGRIVGDDGRAGDRGNRVAPVLHELKSGLGALLIHSKRQVAPVAVLYSPPSMRTQWMLDWQPRGTAWSDRDPSQVYEDENPVRSSMTAFLDFLGRVGLEARVLTPELIEKGALRRGIRVLILPRVLALSEPEAAQIHRFAAAGGTVIADGIPGGFDRHGRRLAKPLLAGLFRTAPRGGKGGASLLDAPPRDRGGELMNILTAAGVEPAFTLTRKDGSRAVNIETQLWRNGTTTILALQRDPGEAAAEPVLLTLRKVARVYDLRAGILWGTARSLELLIDPVVPTLLALSAGPGSAPAIAGASRVVAGGTATITFSPPQGGDGSEVAVLRVELVDPGGEVVAGRSANVLLRGAPIAKRFDFATGDSSGKWRIRATDVLTGNSASKDLEVAGE
jgi:glycosyl hydrolase family 42 (putative beta-galactosidase)